MARFDLDLLPEPGFLLGPGWRILDCNAAAAELLGEEPGALHGRPFAGLAAEASAPALAGWLAQVADGGDGKTPRTVVLRANHASPRWVDLTARVRGAGAERILFVLAREHPRAASQDVLAVLEHLPVPTAVLCLADPEDPTSLTVLGVNERARRFAGFDLAGVVGKRLVDVVPVPQQAGRLGVYAAIAQGAAPQELDLELPPSITRAGHVRMLLWPLPERCVGVGLIDMTARHEAEVRAQLFSQLVEDMPAAVGVWELPEGATEPEALRLMAMNRAAVAMAPPASDSLLGKTLREIVPEAASLEHWQPLVAAVREQRAFELGESQWIDAAGVVHTFVSQCVPLGGRLVAMKAVDITERKSIEEELAQRNEELARSNQELDLFAHVVAHDLQDPLRVVTGYADLLNRRFGPTLDADAAQMLDTIGAASRRMHQLIQSIRSYARLGARACAPERVNLGELVSQVLADLRVSLEEAGGTVERGYLPIAEVDPSQFRQLYQNLIANAIKFRGERPLHVRIAAGRTAEGWELWVQDNGQGIPAHLRERIFELFERGAVPEGLPGSGIGLAICKRIVAAHGGDIAVETAPDGGSIFRFTLPP